MRTVHKTRMKPKKLIETYAGKELSPSDYEPQDINTEDYASVLIELSGGARGVFSVSQVSAGRKNRLSFELDGSRCALAWDQEKPNDMWIGYREKANESRFFRPAETWLTLKTPRAPPESSIKTEA